MWNASFRHTAAAASMLVMAGLCIPPAHADAVWRNDWATSSPPTLSQYWAPAYPAKPSAAVAFDTQGDVLFGAMASTSLDGQFIRLTQNGTLRWSSNVYAFSSDGAYALIPNADGGAYLALGWPDHADDAGDNVVRLDANGSRVWSREVPTGWLAQVASDQIATAGCSRLTLLDGVTGNVVWQRVFNAIDTSCTSGGVVADSQGSLYATFPINVGNTTTGFRTIKVDQTGNELWNVVSAGVGGGSVIGIGGSMLYVSTTTDLLAFRISDGSVAWSAPLSSLSHVFLSGGGVPEPIVLGPNSAQRVAADTGLPRWTQPVPGAMTAANVVNGALFVATSSGSLVKLDLSSGVIAWTIALPASDTSRSVEWLAFGGFNGSSLLAVAKTRSVAAGTPPPLFQRIDFASGTLVDVVPVPPVPQGMSNALNLLDDDGNVVGVGASQQADYSTLRLRRLEGTSGNVLWDIAEPIDDLGGSWIQPPQPQAVVNGDAIAVAFPINSAPENWYPPGPGWLRVDLRDRSTGDLRWRNFLSDDYQQYTRVSTPALDSDGNVIVATGARVSDSYERRTLYKLSAASGAVLWRFDDESPDCCDVQVFPQDFTVLGSDILLVGPFQGSSDTIRRLSGIDGSIVWASSIFASSYGVFGTYNVDAGHVVVFGGVSQTVLWAKLDLQTGNALWTNSASVPPCTMASCSGGGDDLILSDGDILFVGERNYNPSLQRFHTDGSGTIDNWDLPASDPALESWMVRVQNDSIGAIRLYLRRGYGKSQGGVTFLAGFDMTTGALLGQQAIYAYTSDPIAAFSYPDPLLWTAANRLVVSTYSAQPPLPTSMGTALFDTSVTAHGDLIAAVSIDRTQVMPGELVGFHLKATYTGDLPLTGAHMLGNLPWQSGITGLTCSTMSASNCAIDSRSGAINALFDISPGGSIDITGQIRVLDATDTETFTATTYGPIGLSEQDTLNNFARTTVTQSLFRDGFDPP